MSRRSRSRYRDLGGFEMPEEAKPEATRATRTRRRPRTRTWPRALEPGAADAPGASAAAGTGAARTARRYDARRSPAAGTCYPL